jgi:hypothetical protein
MTQLPAQSPLNEEDFEAIEAAVLETARGRWFLAEYARRQRAAESNALMEAIERLEAKVTTERVARETERVRAELADLSGTIAQARDDVLTAFGVQSSGPASGTPARPVLSRAAAAQRAALALRYLEGRVRSLVGIWGPETAAAPARLLQSAPDMVLDGSTLPDLGELDGNTGRGAEAPDAVQAEPVPEPVEASAEADLPEVEPETWSAMAALNAGEAEAAPDEADLIDAELVEPEPAEPGLAETSAIKGESGATGDADLSDEDLFAQVGNEIEAIAEAEAIAESEAPPASSEALAEASAEQPDDYDALATTLRSAIARVRGPSSDIDALSFEAKSVLFA